MIGAPSSEHRGYIVPFEQTCGSQEVAGGGRQSPFRQPYVQNLPLQRSSGGSGSGRHCPSLHPNSQKRVEHISIPCTGGSNGGSTQRPAALQPYSWQVPSEHPNWQSIKAHGSVGGGVVEAPESQSNSHVITHSQNSGGNPSRHGGHNSSSSPSSHIPLPHKTCADSWAYISSCFRWSFPSRMAAVLVRTTARTNVTDAKLGRFWAKRGNMCILGIILIF